MPFRDDLRPDRLLALEEETLARWETEGTFRASLEARRGSKPFVFYEGPPTANGKPGLHHVLARSLKDFACRLQTMRGRLVERRAGWDTHGLPVEIATEKRLGLEGKDAIEKMGIAAFNRACRESVFEYLAEFETQTRRMGYWVDLAAAYLTCSNDYVESLWAILADLHRRGLLYKGHKVLPYCPRCGTPLSSHEVGQGFRDVQDPSVTVRFHALGAAGEALDESFLVWTTTPWTLPSNVALAVHPEVAYVKVRLAAPGGGEGGSEVLWLAEARLSALGAGPGQIEILERVRGADLVGRRYRRLLDLYDVEATPNAFTVRPASFVTTEDGTGIVHMAPAYGEDDAAVGRRDALPTLHPVDAAGRFVAGPRAELVAGLPVKEADKHVLRRLKQEGALFRQETLVHSYPHCWRCDTALLYYARDSWYLATTKFRDRMLELNRSVTWVPESTGTGRFGQWLENNVDWALSRDRYWGTPLPIWVCDGCRRQHAVGAVAELARLAGPLPEPLDLHRPFVDELTWACGEGACRGTMRRTPEVADCWFDSGAMPFAQWHHPFEHRERVEREVPADFIAEGVDQTRGWFYTLLAVATMYADRAAYRTVVSTDLILDKQGKKMSKSRGNLVDTVALFARHPADVVRWHLLCSRPIWQPLRFDEGDLVEVRNRFFGTLANTYQFFAMYANTDGFEPADAAALAAAPPRAVFDRWILSRLDRLVAEVSADLEGYDTARAGRRLVEFVVEDLSNWYVRRNRRRFWKGALTPDKREGYATLHRVLLTVCRLLAPFSPFYADAVHRALLGEVGGPGGVSASVHLADWPTADPAARDEGLEASMAALRTVVSLGHAARQKAGIKVRQPLAALATGHADVEVAAFLREHADTVRDELNVRRMDVVGGLEGSARFTVALNKKTAAPRLGALTAPVAAHLEGLGELDGARAAALRATGADGRVALRLADGREATLEPGDLRFSTRDDAGSASEYGDGVLVRLDTEVTPSLEREGRAREALHALQGLRKTQGLRVSDRVRLTWRAEGGLAEALRAHAAWLGEELLAVEIVEDPALAAPEGQALDVDGAALTARLEVVAG